MQRCLLVCRTSGMEFSLGGKRKTRWRSLLEGSGSSWKLCKLPCHSCQNYLSELILKRLGWAKRWGKVLKSSYVGQTTKGGPIFMGAVDPSRHHGLVYGSRLIRNQANSLLYEKLILHVRICKVLFKNWRFQIKIVGCIISVQACKCICQWNIHSILLCNLT